MAAVHADVDGVREGNGREILEVQRLEKNCNSRSTTIRR